MTEWDNRAERYDAVKWVNDPELLSWCVARAVAFLPLPRQDRPLFIHEIGFGTGALTEALALWRQVHGLVDRIRIVAAEPSVQMRDRARDRFMDPRCAVRDVPDLVVSQTGMLFPPLDPTWEDPGPRTVPDDDGTPLINHDTGEPLMVPSLRPRLPGWDFVVSRMVLHHVADPRRSVAEWLDGVAPGGALAICEGPPPVSVPHPSVALHWLATELKEPGRHHLHAYEIAQFALDAGAVEVAVFERFSSGNSVRNWLDNAGCDPAIAADMLAMHRVAVRDAAVRDAYRAEITTDGDVLMRWRHCVVVARKVA